MAGATRSKTSCFGKKSDRWCYEKKNQQWLRSKNSLCTEKVIDLRRLTLTKTERENEKVAFDASTSTMDAATSFDRKERSSKVTSEHALVLLRATMATVLHDRSSHSQSRDSFLSNI